MLDLSAILNQDIGGLIWIEGEPGVGKSRLMAEFTASIADNGSSHLVWRIYPSKIWSRILPDCRCYNTRYESSTCGYRGTDTHQD